MIGVALLLSVPPKEETKAADRHRLVTGSRLGIRDHRLMMSPVPGRCDHLLHCESVVCIPSNALWSAPKRGQARIGSAPVRLQLRGTVSRRFSEDHEALLEDLAIGAASFCRAKQDLPDRYFLASCASIGTYTRNRA